MKKGKWRSMRGVLGMIAIGTLIAVFLGTAGYAAVTKDDTKAVMKMIEDGDCSGIEDMAAKRNVDFLTFLREIAQAMPDKAAALAACVASAKPERAAEIAGAVAAAVDPAYAADIAGAVAVAVPAAAADIAGAVAAAVPDAADDIASAVAAAVPAQGDAVFLKIKAVKEATQSTTRRESESGATPPRGGSYGQ